jgi:hypothetical protein
MVDILPPVPTFRSGLVTSLLAERPFLQRISVDLGAGDEPAYVLTQLVGPVAVGDQVVVNTTAVELGLGTGGWHVVHWNLARQSWSGEERGHVMKLRYTSLQADVRSAEERYPELADIASISAMPVVAASLHSQLAGVAVAFKHLRPDARLVYVMTDGGSLPIAISELVWQLRERSLLDATVTCGQAFGGDHEAVSLQSALAIARHVERADAVVVAMGPGSAGTATRLGFSGIELGSVLDATVGLGGIPIAALRLSRADPRERHRGVSHHSITALLTATRSRVRIAVPEGSWSDVCAALIDYELDPAGRHEMIPVAPIGIIELMASFGLHVDSMGRPAAVDPVLFEAAAAAGVVAARALP